MLLLLILLWWWIVTTRFGPGVVGLGFGLGGSSKCGGPSFLIADYAPLRAQLKSLLLLDSPSPSSSSSSSSSSSPCSPSSSLPRLQFRTNVSNVKDFHIYCKLHGLSDRTCWFLMETFLLKYRQYFLAAQKEQVQILTSNGGGGGGGGAKNRHDQFTFWPICADKQFYLLSTYHLCESNLDRLGDHFWFLLSKQQLLSLVHKDELDFDSLTVCFGDRVWNKLMNFQVIDI